MIGRVDLFGYVEGAIDGLSHRQQVIAQNIANVNTPGYAAARVDFESHLADAVEAGAHPESVELRAATLVGAHNNTVDLEEEMTSMIKTQLLRSTMISTFNARTTAIRTALES